MKIKNSQKIINFRTAGIICELNPPHIGHQRLFDGARGNNPDAALVCVMSGNFVQRGEPAVFPKGLRARAAVAMGADLVAELPAPFALSSAESFARAGVTLLDALNVDALVFGSESGDTAPLLLAADALDLPETQSLTREYLRGGISYAAARQNALNAVLGANADVLRTPNNMLGIEYLRAIRGLGAEMIPFALPRTEGVSSADIRAAIKRGDNAWDKVPESARNIFAGAEPVFPEALDIAALSRLRVMSLEAFRAVPGGGDGVAERAYRYSRECAMDELAAAIKTKRHALSRVRRYLFAAALGLRAETAVPHIRVLALNERGREVLRNVTALPVITKPAHARKFGAESLRFMEIESNATDFYVLAYSDKAARRGGGEWMYRPEIM